MNKAIPIMPLSLIMTAMVILIYFLINHRTDFGYATRMRLQQNADGSVSRAIKPQTAAESNRLYRNDNNRFTDITVQAGLVSASFGLSASVTDLNRDGWLDIYVANDYIEPDNIYINNGNGTFTDQYSTYLRHSSQNSMGSDIADINNDGLEDIIVLDMKAEDPIRYKKLAHVMQQDRYNLLVQYGYGRQVGRNVLQLNTGNNTFIEIGQFAGVATTDWSWAPLMADYNNDGWRDIYITNGYRKDVTDLDYMNFFMDSVEQTGGLTPQRFPDINEFLKYIPSEKVSNYLYLNNGDLTFHKANAEAGMDQPSFSNGAAYADLDLDGDIDLVTNNIDDTAFIYRNDIEGSNWIQIEARLENHNTKGIGTSVDLYSSLGHQCGMIMPGRGFLSSSEAMLHFGLNDNSVIDSIILRWPDGSVEKKSQVHSNQRMVWKKGFGENHTLANPITTETIFQAVSNSINWVHQENSFNDLTREKLLPYMMSHEGPCLAVGDVNGDKLEDIFVGNGSGFPAALMKQNADGSFSDLNVNAFTADKSLEACDVVLEDFDNDKDLDLIVISGGSAFKKGAPEYATRYYINDGKGVFNIDNQFPNIKINGGAVLAIDIDGDQDKDIILGGRSVPGEFPRLPESYVLINSNGKFQDVTDQLLGNQKQIGMVTDITSADLNGDGKPEILFAGEWMPLTVFSLVEGRMVNQTSQYGLDKTSGWWKCSIAEDIDGDGDIDILAGNSGLNHRLQASEASPLTLVANDFDQNGSTDPVMCYYHEGQLYPYAGRDLMIQQLPYLKKKFQRYGSYAKATLSDIFPQEQLQQSQRLFTNTFETTYFKNDNGKFSKVSLPYQVQLSPMYDMICNDFNKDGRKDILMVGNFSYSETETGEMDAGNGSLLVQLTDGSFEYVPNIKHGFWAKGEARDLALIHLVTGKEAILTGNNSGRLEVNVISPKAKVLN